MVVPHDRPRAVEQVERLEQLVADLRVRLDDPPLLVVEGARLEQDAVRDADLPDVVEDRAEADRLDVLRCDAEVIRDADRQRRKPFAVAVQVRVARLDRVRERAGERGGEQALASSSRERDARSSASATAFWSSACANGLVTRPAAPRVSAWLSVSYVPAPGDEQDRQRRLAAARRLDELLRECRIC